MADIIAQSRDHTRPFGELVESPERELLTRYLSTAPLWSNTWLCKRDTELQTSADRIAKEVATLLHSKVQDVRVVDQGERETHLTIYLESTIYNGKIYELQGTRVIASFFQKGFAHHSFQLEASLYMPLPKATIPPDASEYSLQAQTANYISSIYSPAVLETAFVSRFRVFTPNAQVPLEVFIGKGRDGFWLNAALRVIKSVQWSPQC